MVEGLGLPARLPPSGEVLPAARTGLPSGGSIPAPWSPLPTRLKLMVGECWGELPCSPLPKLTGGEEFRKCSPAPTRLKLTAGESWGDFRAGEALEERSGESLPGDFCLSTDFACPGGGERWTVDEGVRWKVEVGDCWKVQVGDLSP